MLDLGLLEAARSLRDKEKTESESNIPAELKAYVEAKIEERKNAKLNKDYQLADEIRAELLSKGIAITDTKEGTKYTVV